MEDIGCVTLGMISTVACGVRCWMWPMSFHVQPSCDRDLTNSREWDTLWWWWSCAYHQWCFLHMWSGQGPRYIGWCASSTYLLPVLHRVSLLRFVRPYRLRIHRPPPTSAPLQLSCLSEFRKPDLTHYIKKDIFYFNITVCNASLLEKVHRWEELIIFLLPSYDSISRWSTSLLHREGRRGGLPWILFKLAAPCNDGCPYYSVVISEYWLLFIVWSPGYWTGHQLFRWDNLWSMVNLLHLLPLSSTPSSWKWSILLDSWFTRSLLQGELDAKRTPRGPI